eukprot:m.137555 g.137555  ORF g.137555 m.137555 type:complete len:505 (-) comp11907_c0_seq1:45-1559(-)
MDPELADAVGKTIELMGPLLKKPPVNEKLLKRPPFKYLHNMVTQLMHEYEFFKGLYTEEEMNPENVSSKESKVEFLTKAIDVTAIVTGKKLKAKPSKIVAGKEAVQTNKWLQMVAVAIQKKKSSDAAVEAVLHGGEASSEEKRESTSEKDLDKQSRRGRPQSDPRKLRGGRMKSASEEHMEATGEDLTVDDSEQEPNETTSRHHTQPEEKEKMEESHVSHKHDQASRQPQHEESHHGEAQDTHQEEDDQGSDNHLHHSHDAEEEAQLPGNIQKQVKRRERPSSARPAPPRVRRPGSNIDNESISSRNASARDRAPVVDVIVAGNDDKDEADDHFVVGDAKDVAQPSTSSATFDTDDGGERGALMRKIIAKKQVEGSGDENSHDNDAQKKLDRQHTQKEIEQLRDSVQKLCKSTNPLGRLVDYLLEDVESMKKEMTTWKKESQEYTSKMASEEMKLQESLEPLRGELNDLTQQVVDKQSLILSQKAKVLENQDKINRILSNLTKG